MSRTPAGPRAAAPIATATPRGSPQRRPPPPADRHRHVPVHRHRGLDDAARSARNGRFEAALARHRGLIRAEVLGARGAEIGTEGDSFFIVFVPAGAAVEGAVDAQRRLQGEPWPAGDEIRVRMGLHSGLGALDRHGSYVSPIAPERMAELVERGEAMSLDKAVALGRSIVGVDAGGATRQRAD